jgi:hypothetical protein
VSGRWDAERFAPKLALTAVETHQVVGALRRYLHRGVSFSEPGPTTEEVELLLDRLFNYWVAVRRWEDLHLGEEDQLPF